MKHYYTAPKAESEAAELQFAILAESYNGTAPELEDGWTLEW